MQALATTLERLLTEARQGRPEAREELLARYTPLVLKVGAQVSGRYLRVGQDEEISVGLLALNEAIDSYDPGRGSFVGFAQLVIKRRLADHYRRQRVQELPLSALEAEDEGGRLLAGVEARAALAVYEEEQSREATQAEIAKFSERLSEFGIRFADLVKVSPKHQDARERALAAARAVAERPDLRAHLLTRRELPLKELEGLVEVSRKTLERQRRFIVAAALLLIEDYNILGQYVGQAGGVGFATGGRS